ncbi:MAG TPA: UDP-N-acetylmuramoyl-tripeptide--D-alanyl-D-alanine ligase [Pseudoneobacillus sp.]|nr:UDP-N-acetylmuramoyl-tripeptide--D-alanyl-D-alanine ligase [Pseudoneobacillus sp.]
MKHLLLSEIIKIIDGTIISKTENNPLIKNVISKKNHRITNSTLIFFPNKSRLMNKKKLKSCVIVTQRPEIFQTLNKNFTIVKVKNSEKAYKKFIEYYRNLFQIPVIGITGTCGKTTTKEMVSSILGENMRLVKTILSRNARTRNLTYLMQMDEQTDAAVIEVGVGFPGGIRNFASYFKPTIGVITNIGTDHMKGFKTHEAYIQEKASLIKFLNNKGTIILNKDDEIIQTLNLTTFKGKIFYFGLCEDADIRASNIKYGENGMSFIVHYGSQSHECSISGFGKHNVYNTLAALAVSTSLGIEIKEAIERLKNFQHIQRHLEFHVGINNCTLIDDTWNTNSKSIESALEVLSNISNGRKTIAVLGDIEELGDLSEREHEKIGAFIKEFSINQLVTIGKESTLIAKRAMELGMNSKDIFSIDNQTDLVSILKKITDANSLVLIKTSMRNSFSNTLKKLIKD